MVVRTDFWEISLLHVRTQFRNQESHSSRGAARFEKGRNQSWYAIFGDINEGTILEFTFARAVKVDMFGPYTQGGG